MTSELLLIVIAICILFLCALRARRPRSSPESVLQIIETIALGTHQRICVVRYRQRELLLGVSSAGVLVLGEDQCRRNDFSNSRTDEGGESCSGEGQMGYNHE